MADYTTENLELIVRYDGSKSSFDSSSEKASYISAQISKVVFITGSTASNASTTDKTQHIWVSNGTSHKYLDMTNINDIKDGLTHIAGFAIEGEIKSSAGANGINFKGANGISITLNPPTSTDQNGVPYWNVQVDGQGVIDTIKGVSTDSVNTLTLYGVKNYAQAAANTAKNEVIGKDTDTESSDTIKGAKKHADKVKTDLEGTTSDTKDSATIEGAKRYADDAVAKIVSDGNDEATDDTIKGAKKYTDEAKESLLGKSGDASTENTIYGAKAYADTKDITIDSTNTDNTLAGKFVIKKDGEVLATINIPKELVVTKDGSEIVKGTWSGDTFTESETGPDKALKLSIQNQTTPIYINVADLVDVYTASSVAADVKISIDDNNVISATITAVSGTKIIPNTIDKDKLTDAVKELLNNADSAYQKPTTGIPKSDLAEGVKSSLDKADSAIVGLGGDEYIGVENVGASTTEKKITAKTSEITSETATTDGLATVADIRAYLAARFSVKVVS